MTMSTCARVLFSFIVSCLSGYVAAQQPPPQPSPSGCRVAAVRVRQPTPDASPTPRDPMSTPTFNGLRLRSIGPAFTSGRIIGFAVDPNNPARYFVARRIRRRVEDNQRRHNLDARSSITKPPTRSALSQLDPKNPLVVWVGTGENNSQRSVSYGNGLYKSEDGGRTWRNVGLRTSEHIGRIAIDPKDSNIVYVASQGPLWGPGGERGLFKTTDGGKTWKNILNISEHTGVTDVVIDQNDPNTIYCAVVSTPPPHVDADQRWSGKRDLQIN